MTRAYKITHLPEGYSKLAVAAWKSLNDRELFEIEGEAGFHRQPGRLPGGQ